MDDTLPTTTVLEDGRIRTQLTVNQRRTRAFFLFIPFLVAGGFMLLHADDRDGLLMPFLIFGSGIIGSYALWIKRSVVEPAHEIVHISPELRRKKLKVTGILFATALVIIAIVAQTSAQPFGSFVVGALFAFLAAGGYAIAVAVQPTKKVFRTPYVKPTPLGTAGKPKPADEFPWYFRYPLAIAVIVGLFEMPDNAAQHWWVPVVMVCFAAVLMFEILVFAVLAAIIGGLVSLFFGAVAGIPTSAAIIIGALIIANSNK